MAIMVNTERALVREAANTLEGILRGSFGLQIRPKPLRPGDDQRFDMLFGADSGPNKFRFAVEVKQRITPQIALSVAERLHGLPDRLIPLVYSPVVSPRVAEILTEEGIGYLDRAGNCRLRSQKPPLLIERQGFHTKHAPTPAAADPFSPKSSRIVRAMLAKPTDGWQVRQLAEHPDVRVSPGLVVKVKRALLEEGYAVERQRLLYLRDADGLLKAWGGKYPGPAEQLPLYFRGNAESAEEAVGRWCNANDLRYALAGFSAAWRLSAEVRYNVADVYVEDRGFEKDMIDRLIADYGGKRVETGPTLMLWRPFDPSVFAFNESSVAVPVTSPVQTYLDVRRAPGRGEDAATAVYRIQLNRDFQAVAERAKEWSRGDN